jgi:hypothetical protein
MKRIKWDSRAEKDIWRAICAPNKWFNEKDQVSTHPRSLWWFVHLAWGAEWYFQKHPEQPRWLVEHIHGPYISWLQAHLLKWKSDCLKGGTDRYYIASVLPRGFGKTVIATKSAMLWMHLDEPDMSSLVASATLALSQDIYNAIRSVLSGDDDDAWFSWLYGDWKSGAKIWTDTYLHHAFRKSKNLSEPSIDTTAVGIGMTGYHHRAHNWDDPITINKLREGSEAYSRSVHAAVNASYNALQTNGLMMLTLTRYFDDDVAGRHFREEGIKSWTGMPCPNMAMFEKVPLGKGVWHVYFLQTEDELTGEPTHPLLWDRAKIIEAKRRDPEDFSCQQQNNPGTSERAPLLESQIRDLFVDYDEFLFKTPIEYATVHIDTAFKAITTIRTGDDSAIVVWLHDARRNGIIYLDTDLLQASNEWREEQFNEQLVRTLLTLRRRATYVKKLTDEREMGGKFGVYRNRLLSILQGAGLALGTNQFIQLNRTQGKDTRIRTSIGYWVEGYVRILLHRDQQGQWIIPALVRKFFNQILRLDAVQHKDMADAAADVFTPGIWVRPQIMGNISEDGTDPWQPADEFFKSLGRRMTTTELYRMMDQENEEIQNTQGPTHGWTVEDYDDLPRDPI